MASRRHHNERAGLENYALILCVFLFVCTTWACADDSGGKPWRIEKGDADAGEVEDGDDCLGPSSAPTTPRSNACGQVGRKACYDGTEYTCREGGELERTAETCCQTEISSFGITNFSAETASFVPDPSDTDCGNIQDGSFEWKISTSASIKNLGNRPIQLKCGIGECVGGLSSCTDEDAYWEDVFSTTQNIVIEVGGIKTIASEYVVSERPCTPRSIVFECIPELGLPFRPTGKSDPYYQACQWGPRESNHLTCTNSPHTFETAPWMLAPPVQTR